MGRELFGGAGADRPILRREKIGFILLGHRTCKVFSLIINEKYTALFVRSHIPGWLLPNATLRSWRRHG